ncbi:MAG: hypothetical protein WAU11_02380 [Ignavibacteriaceae bacterium]
MRTFNISLSFIIVSVFLFNSCNKNESIITTPESPSWKNEFYKTVFYREYSIQNTSNYSAFNIANNTFYSLIDDSITFNQLFTYTPQIWDPTYIPNSMFDANFGVLISDKWTDRITIYFIEGLYLYENKLYLNYNHEKSPMDPKEEMYKNFLLVLIDRCDADSLILVENDVEKMKYSITN